MTSEETKDDISRFCDRIELAEAQREAQKEELEAKKAEEKELEKEKFL